MSEKTAQVVLQRWECDAVPKSMIPTCGFAWQRPRRRVERKKYDVRLAGYIPAPADRQSSTLPALACIPFAQVHRSFDRREHWYRAGGTIGNPPSWRCLPAHLALMQLPPSKNAGRTEVAWDGSGETHGMGDAAQKTFLQAMTSWSTTTNISLEYQDFEWPNNRFNF